MNVQRYLSNPLFDCRRFALLAALGGVVAVGSCSGKDTDEDIGGIGEKDEASGIEDGDGKNSNKKKKPKPKDDSDMSNLPDPNDDKGTGGDGEGGPDEVPGELPCEIDFLFVIDHSGSMASEQDNLSNAVPDFIETVTKEIDELEDYHIAVVTTGGSQFGGNFGSPGCQKIGAMVTRTSGQNSSNRSCGPYANGKKFMTKGDDLEDKFVCAAKPGTSGTGDEKPMEAMLAAVSKELNTEQCNAGFLRKDALLVVTIITDEEDDTQEHDQSSGSPGDPKIGTRASSRPKATTPRTSWS